MASKEIVQLRFCHAMTNLWSTNKAMILIMAKFSFNSVDDVAKSVKITCLNKTFFETVKDL